MVGKLDEISRAIGSLEAQVSSLVRSVDQDRDLANERHRENSEKLESIGTRVEKIEADVKPLAKTVATMEPIVAGYAVTRWKVAGAFALGTTLVTVLGWVVSLFAGKLIAWVASLFISK
jgi:outer membrane murein-binding lipoprotein Lpp